MKKISSLLIIMAGIVWGLMGIFVNEMDKFGFTSTQTASIRVTVAAITLFLMLFITDKDKLKIRLKDLYIFMLLGFVCIFGMSLLYFYSIANTSLSVAAILLYTSPIWVIIISALFLHEKITWQKILAVALAFVGCAFVSGIGDAKSIKLVFFLTGLGSGLAYGLYSIFGTVALRKYHPYTVTAYSFLFAAIAAWFFSSPIEVGEIALAYPNKPVIIIMMLATGIVTAVLPFMLYTAGLKYTPPGKAAIMASVEPLMATIIGFFVYGQPASILGIMLIMLAILVVNNFGLKK